MGALVPGGVLGPWGGVGSGIEGFCASIGNRGLRGLKKVVQGNVVSAAMPPGTKVSEQVG